MGSMVDFLRGNVPNSPDLFLCWAACASSWNVNLFVSMTIVMVPGSVVRGRVSLLISHSGRAFDATEIGEHTIRRPTSDRKVARTVPKQMLHSERANFV